MKSQIRTLCLIALLSSFASAKLDRNAEYKKTATEVLETYAKSKFISVDIEKVDKKLTLGTKTTSKGSLKYSAGKIYLVLQADKKTELFLKNGKLTLVDYPDLDFDKDGVRKVTHITDKTPAFLKSLLNIFSSPKDFFSQFKLTDAALTKNLLTLNLKPISSNLSNFKLELDIKEKLIRSIQFADEINTQTSINFSNLNLKKNIPKATFDFKSIKSDQEVTQ